MSKKINLMLIIILIMSIFTGCQLADENAGENTENPKEPLVFEDQNGNKILSTDALVGAFITFQPLSNYDEEGRVYATITEDADGMDSDNISFGQSGYVFAYITMQKEGMEPYSMVLSDAVFCDVKSEYNVLSVDEDLTTIERNLSGEIYYMTTHLSEVKVIWVNPMYQTEEGELFAVPAVKGIQVQTELADYTLQSDYNANQGELSIISNISVDIVAVEMPTQICILQMNAQHSILSWEYYQPGEVAPEIIVEDNTSYVLVETMYTLADGSTSVVREVYDEKSEHIGTYSYLENNFVIKKLTKLIW